MESTAGERARGEDENEEVDSSVVLMQSKPLHRFIKGEPRCLGVVVLMFGFAELLMGFQLAKEKHINSSSLYVPFWQGALFIISGNLSIYTELHPSKKMVTVCLSMYVVALLGIVISIGNRIFCLVHLSFESYRMVEWYKYRINQLWSIEVILFISSLCVSILLIFLSTMARLALKSTNTQVIVQHVLPELRDTST